MTQTDPAQPVSATQPPLASQPVPGSAGFAADIVSQPPSTFDQAGLDKALQPDPPSARAQWLTKALALLAVFAIGIVVGVVADRQWGSPATQQGPGSGNFRNFPGGGFPGGQFPGGQFPGGGQGNFQRGQNGGQFPGGQGGGTGGGTGTNT